MVQYVLECIAFQLVFLIIYDFFLKRETFFQWNRAYLIGTYILSMILPWVKIEALKTTVPEQYYVYPEFLLNIDVAAVTPADDSFWSNISWESVLLVSGMFLAALYFQYKLFQIYRLRKTGQVRYFPNFTRVVVANSEMAFSFFKSIFLGDKVLEKEHQSIIQHELVHIEQRHSWDLLFFELMRIVGWFNPLVYVYQKRVSELHEFIADYKVAKTHKKEQYELLLSQVFQTENISFINQFFKSSLIKKRIAMLQKAKSKSIWQLKYLMLVPLVLGMLVYTSCEQQVNHSEIFNDKIVENGNTLIFSVVNLDELTEQEKNKRQELLNKLFKSDKFSTLVLEDEDNESIKISVDNGKVSKMEVDKSNSFNSNDNALSSTIAKYNALIAERERLLRSADEKNPIIVNLNKHIDELNKQIDKSIGTIKIAQTYTGEVMNRYQELLTKRRSLSKYSVEEESQIKEIDEQLRGMLKGSNWGGTNSWPFFLVDEVPIFLGCENEADKRNCFNEKLREHIVEHFKYPQEAQEKGIQGKVNIQFIIDELGNIINIKKRGPDASLEAEAERIIKLLPKLKPGKQQGRITAVSFSLPISFKLQ